MVIEMNIIHPVMKYRNVPAISVPAAYQFFGKELFATDNGSSWWEKETNDSSSANDSNRAIIPHLKPIVPPAKQGGDWMYRCALSAAEFNVQIRSERCDRLSGKSISINDGEQEEEEEELEAPAMRKKEPTKEGFLDIHTNVYQLPRNTQMSNFRVHSLGVNLEDFSRSEPQTGEMEIYISNTNDNQVNEHIQKYPVAVIAGQYQGTLPV